MMMNLKLEDNFLEPSGRITTQERLYDAIMINLHTDNDVF